ncbi:ANR family transcriptional regulator [Escherichia coli]|nr:ANR family transcriptional regulator [Escherichia coli]
MNPLIIERAISYLFERGSVTRDYDRRGFGLYSVTPQYDELTGAAGGSNKFIEASKRAARLESRGLFRRAGAAWLDAMMLAPTDRTRQQCVARRRSCASMYKTMYCESQNCGAHGNFNGTLPAWAG